MLCRRMTGVDFQFDMKRLKKFVLISVAARSKAWVCGHLLAGIMGSNPRRCMDGLSPVSVVCCQVEISATS